MAGNEACRTVCGRRADLPPPRRLLGARLRRLLPEPRFTRRPVAGAGPEPVARKAPAGAAWFRGALRPKPASVSVPPAAPGDGPLGPRGGQAPGHPGLCTQPPGLATGRAGKGRVSPRTCVLGRVDVCTPWALASAYTASTLPQHRPRLPDFMGDDMAVQCAACLWPWPLRPCGCSLEMARPLPGTRAGLGPRAHLRLLPDWPPLPAPRWAPALRPTAGRGQGLREPGGGTSEVARRRLPGRLARAQEQGRGLSERQRPRAWCRGRGGSGISPQPLGITSPCQRAHLSQTLSRQRPHTIGLRSCGGHLPTARVRGPPLRLQGHPLGARLAVCPTGSPLAHIPLPHGQTTDSGGGRWREVARLGQEEEGLQALCGAWSWEGAWRGRPGCRCAGQGSSAWAGGGAWPRWQALLCPGCP